MKKGSNSSEVRILNLKAKKQIKIKNMSHPLKLIFYLCGGQITVK